MKAIRHYSQSWGHMRGAILLALFFLLFAAAGAQAQQVFSGADPHIRYNGRVTLDTSWPYSPDNRRVITNYGDTDLNVKFTGSATVSATFVTDNGLAVSYLCLVDGVVQKGLPLYNFYDSGRVVTIASGLDAGATHTLQIRRNSDSGNNGWVQTITLDTGGALLAPDPPSSRRIEFYGDSVTAGCCLDAKSDPDGYYTSELQDYQSQGKTSDVNNDGDWYDDNYNTYGAITARNLGAEGRWVAKGGEGLIIGRLPGAASTLSNYWNKTTFNAYDDDGSGLAGDPDWGLDISLDGSPQTQWVPQVVVIAIGHNDLTRAVNESDFIAAYQTLITEIQNKYPGVTIFCMNTSIDDAVNSNGYGYQLYTDLFSSLSSLPGVYTQAIAGDPQGPGVHPRAADHQQMADTITPWIRGVMGW